MRLLRCVGLYGSKEKCQSFSINQIIKQTNTRSFSQLPDDRSSSQNEDDGFKYDFEDDSRSDDRFSSKPRYQSNRSERSYGRDRPNQQSDRSYDRPSYQSNNRSGYQTDKYQSNSRPSYRSNNQSSYQSKNQSNYQSNRRSVDRGDNQRSRSNYQSNYRSNYRSFDEAEHQSSIPQPRGEFLYGQHPCIAALTACLKQTNKRTIYRIYIQRGSDPEMIKSIEKLRTEIIQSNADDEASDIPLQWIDRHSLNIMCEQRPHNGVILDCSPISVDQVDHIIDSRGVSVLLDCLTDPSNIGSIVRSSAFLGAQCIYLSKKNCAKLSPVLSKASAGALELTELAYVKSTTRFIREARLANPRLHVIGLTADVKAISCRDIVSVNQSTTQSPAQSSEQSVVQPIDQLVSRPILLVCGSEGEGLRTVVKNECETLAFIQNAPTCPELVDSLNVSQALTIALYQCTK